MEHAVRQMMRGGFKLKLGRRNVAAAALYGRNELFCR